MQPLNPKPNFNTSDKFRIIVVGIFLISLLVILGFLVGLLLRQRASQFSQPFSQVQATSTLSAASLASTLLIPQTGCGTPTLAFGTATFQIQNLIPSADGSLNVPADTSGIAYWIQAGNANPVFVLSPTPQNITVMSSATIGSTAKVTWADCSSTLYSLSAAQPASLDGSIFTGQPAEEITVFLPTVSSGAGFVFKGSRTAEPVLAPVEKTTVPAGVPSTEIIASPTAENIIPTAAATIPPPDYSQVLAEIGLQDTSLSLFRTSLKIEVSIYNFGTLPLTLSEENVTLTQPDGTRLALKSSKPNLPMDVLPGETKTVELNFDPPASPIATLKILTVEYDIEGY